MGKNRQSMSPLLTALAEHTTTRGGLHTGTEAMHTQATAVLRLEGSLHFSLLIPKILDGVKTARITPRRTHRRSSYHGLPLDANISDWEKSLAQSKNF